MTQSGRCRRTGSCAPTDDFDAFFVARRENLCRLIEDAMGKRVQRDADEGHSTEGSAQFEPEGEDRQLAET